MRKGLFMLVGAVAMLAAASPKFRIGYYGHSMFEIVLPSGVRIITDPFELATGPDFPVGVEADVVVMSHSHTDHSYYQGIQGSPDLITWVDGSSHGIDFTATATKHFPAGAEGENHIMSWETEGFKFAHMGDYGDELSSADSAVLANTTFLFLPVGGYYTMDAAGADDIINNTGPVVAFPMHYRTPDHSANFANLLTLEQANEFFNFPIVEHDPWIAIDPDNLPEGPVIWEPDYSGDLPADLTVTILNAHSAIIRNNSSFDAFESAVIRLIFDGAEMVFSDTGSISAMIADQEIVYGFLPWNPPVSKEYKVFAEVVCPADENPANDTISEDIFFEAITEAPQVEALKLEISNTPHGPVVIEYSFPGEEAELLICDVTGKVVDRIDLIDDKGVMHYRQAGARGVYFARLRASAGSVVGKFIKLD